MIKLAGKVILILIFCYFSFVLLTSPQPWIILDAANLVFHEAGHMIFHILGRFMTVLGGSLFQILFPSGFFVYFFIRQQWFSCSVILFWIADNIINVSVYMKDALVLKLPLLVEGSTHDWNWIFGEFGLLTHAVLIGTIFFYLGAILLIISLLSMIYFTLADTVQQ